MQSAIVKVMPQIRQAMAQSRQMSSVVSSKPLVRVSLPEKIVHGVLIAGSCLGIPAWVLLNLRKYRGVE